MCVPSRRLIWILLSCLVAGSAVAGSPPFIPVQGVVRSSDGTPLQGEVSMEFALYTVESGGSALWTEQQTLEVEEGMFVAYLGELTPLALSTFRDQGDLWLGVRVESDTELPRVYLGTTPFSGYAEHCGQVPDHIHDFTEVAGTMQESALPDAVVLGTQSCPGDDKVSGIGPVGELICSGDEQGTLDDMGCSSGQVLKWSGSSWACSQDNTLSESQVDSHVADNGYVTGLDVVTRTASVMYQPDGNDHVTEVGCPAGTVLLDCGMDDTAGSAWTAVDTAYMVDLAEPPSIDLSHGIWVYRAHAQQRCKLLARGNAGEAQTYVLRAFCLELSR